MKVGGGKEWCIELKWMRKREKMGGWGVGMVGRNGSLVEWIVKMKRKIDCGSLGGLEVGGGEG